MTLATLCLTMRFSIVIIKYVVKGLFGGIYSTKVDLLSIFRGVLLEDGILMVFVVLRISYTMDN